MFYPVQRYFEILFLCNWKELNKQERILINIWGHSYIYINLYIYIDIYIEGPLSLPCYDRVGSLTYQDLLNYFSSSGGEGPFLIYWRKLYWTHNQQIKALYGIKLGRQEVSLKAHNLTSWVFGRKSINYSHCINVAQWVGEYNNKDGVLDGLMKFFLELAQLES